MTLTLKKKKFQRADLELPEVQAFDCGPAPWQVQVASWIKSRSGDNSVLEDIDNYGIDVWLHRTADGTLVGYSSLGANNWSLPLPKGPKTRINYIPFIGVHRNFQGEPSGASQDDKYAYQILDELIEVAAERTRLSAVEPDPKKRLHSVIGLSVDQRNRQAIKFYLNRDFVDTKSPRPDKAAGVVYDRMILDISEFVANPLVLQPA